MENKLGIKFLDFWNGFNPETDALFGRWLQENSDKVYLGGEDIVIFSVFGLDNLKYKNSVRVFHTNENFMAHSYPILGNKPLSRNVASEIIDSICDYSILSFDIGKNNIRLPNYIRRYGFESISRVINRTIPQKTKDMFYCYSVPYEFRNQLGRKFMSLFNVDSPCNCLRNSNTSVNDKVSYMQQHKTCIAIENSIEPQYNTEKIYDCYLAKTVPIYYGDPSISNDFDINSMVLMEDKIDSRVIDEIELLLRNEEFFMKKLSLNPIINHSLFTKNNFDNFMKRVITHD
jgi:hypothetical protein